MDKCGANGCKLSTSSTYLDCESLCNATSGCMAYVFSNSGCDVPPGNNVYGQGAEAGKISIYTETDKGRKRGKP